VADWSGCSSEQKKSTKLSVLCLNGHSAHSFSFRAKYADAAKLISCGNFYEIGEVQKSEVIFLEMQARRC